MAAAIATLSVGNSWDDIKYFVGGNLVVTASPATYTAGGIALNLNQSDVKASRTPSDVQIQGTGGFIYSYVKGSDNSNGKLKIFVQDGVSQNPLAELTDASAIPAGVSGDTISFQGRWKGML